MKPSQIFQSAGGPPKKFKMYLGHEWGALGSLPQKGIITFGLAANRQNPFAGAMHDAIFNTWRRFASQFWFIAPPVIAGYYILEWANKRNEYLNSKAGRAEFAEGEES